MSDTFVPSERVNRLVYLSEINTPPAPNSFDVDLIYASYNLPDWFSCLQPIVEDKTFTSLTIRLGDKTRYEISIAPVPGKSYKKRSNLPNG